MADIQIDELKEIDRYRKKIERLEACIDKKDMHIRELENLIEKMKVIPNARRIAVGLEPIITHEEMQNTITDDLIKVILKK